MSRLRALWALIRRLISPPEAPETGDPDFMDLSPPRGASASGGENRLGPPPLPASARVAARSLASVTRINGPVETTGITFERVRIGEAKSWVCSLCAEVIAPVGKVASAYQLADHRRRHRQLGDI